jgi:hypothetical protein
MYCFYTNGDGFMLAQTAREKNQSSATDGSIPSFEAGSGIPFLSGTVFDVMFFDSNALSTESELSPHWGDN